MTNDNSLTNFIIKRDRVFQLFIKKMTMISVLFKLVQIELYNKLYFLPSVLPFLFFTYVNFYHLIKNINLGKLTCEMAKIKRVILKLHYAKYVTCKIK